MSQHPLKQTFSPRAALYLLPLAFLGVFFFYPLAAVVVESFAPGGRLDLAPRRRAVARALFRPQPVVHHLAGGRFRPR